MAATKKNIKDSKYGLSGSSKKSGVNFWRSFFTAYEKNSATEQLFFIELEFLNPALSPAEPLLGFKPRVTITEEDLQYTLAGTLAAKDLKSENIIQPSYVAVRFGTLGAEAKQLCSYHCIKNIRFSIKPFTIQMDNKIFGEDCLSGYINISEEEYQATFIRCRDCLYELAKKQSSSIEQDKPTHKFIQKLYSLIESGQVVLLDRDNPFDFKPVNYIGYQDDENYYLNADIAHKQVKRLCNEQDEAFSISKNGLIKALAEEGLTICDKGKNTTSIRIGDKTLRFICLIKDKADAVAALAQ